MKRHVLSQSETWPALPPAGGPALRGSALTARVRLRSLRLLCLTSLLVIGGRCRSPAGCVRLLLDGCRGLACGAAGGCSTLTLVLASFVCRAALAPLPAGLLCSKAAASLRGLSLLLLRVVALGGPGWLRLCVWLAPLPVRALLLLLLL